MKLHLEGTNSEGVYESGATLEAVRLGRLRAPFAVFDEDAQENVAGPYDTFWEARAARSALVRNIPGAVAADAKVELEVTLRLRLPADACDVRSWCWPVVLNLCDDDDARLIEVRSYSKSKKGG